MRIRKNYKFTLVALLLTSIISGSLLGVGVVLAHDTWQELNVGWNYIYGYQDESPAWSYELDAWEWLKSDKTRVDFDSVHYYDGEGHEAYDPYFNELIVFDQDYNDWTTYWTFNGWDIEGINRTCDPSPNFIMDTISSSNEYVILQQYVTYGAGRFSDYVITWVEY